MPTSAAAASREREEYDVGVRGQSIDVERRHRTVPDAPAAPAAAAAALVAPDDIASCERNRRVPGEQADELLARVAGGAGNGDARLHGRRAGARGCVRALWLLSWSSVRREYLYIRDA